MTLEEMIAAQNAEAAGVIQEEESDNVEEESARKEREDFEEVPIEDLPEKPTLEEAREEEFAFVRRPSQESPSWKDKTVRIPDISEPEDLGGDENIPSQKPIVELTDEQKAIFSYFMPVKGMETQLCKALTGASAHLRKKESAASGNLIIQGGQGSGKTTLATSIIKVLQQETGQLEGKIGKIHAEALNQKDIAALMGKVSGGCLIIEQAGELSHQ